jgi:outer membrane protein assembly factor BamB
METNMLSRLLLITCFIFTIIGEVKAANGDLAWSYSTSDIVTSSPSIGPDGTVYVGSWDTYLYALNPDGTLKWRFETQDWVLGSPAVSGSGRIYFGSFDFNLYALNPDGTLAWTFETGDQIRSTPAFAADGSIIFGSKDGNLYSLSPSGSLNWTYTADDWIWSSPAIADDGTIYFGSDDTFLHALNPDGTLKWKFKTDDWIDSSPAIGEDGTIYVGSWDNNIYAINPDGTLKWQFNTGDWVTASPVIDRNGSIYVGSYDGRLYRVSSSGARQWAINTGGAIPGTALIGADGTIYVGSNNGDVYAISSTSASVRWRYDTTENVDSSPALGADGNLYIGSNSGELIAIETANTELADSPWPKFNRDNSLGSSNAYDPSVPVASISAPTSVNEGTTINLDGSASAPVNPDNSLVYEWSQVSGPAISFSSTTSEQVTVQAPLVSANTEITVQLVVYENDVASAPATATIQILNLNRAPTVSLGNDITVSSGQRVTLTAQASDPDDDVLSYTWEQTLGSSISYTETDNTITFTAPTVASSTNFEFQVTVSDGSLEASDSVVVTVTEPNNAPVVDAGPNQTVNEQTTVSLQATATDADGDTLSISWQRLSGPAVSITNATSVDASFRAPALRETAQIVLEVSASDGLVTVTDQVTITVNPVNESPTVDAGSARTVDEGSTVNLSGSASDPDGDDLTYSWTQTSGPSVSIQNASALNASFTAPSVTSNTSVVLQLAVSDGTVTVTDSVTITVRDTSTPPPSPPPSGDDGGGGGGSSEWLILLMLLLYGYQVSTRNKLHKEQL